jgi:hypothetical protein
MSVRATNRITPFRDVLFSNESAAILYEMVALICSRPPVPRSKSIGELTDLDP